MRSHRWTIGAAALLTLALAPGLEAQEGRRGGATLDRDRAERLERAVRMQRLERAARMQRPERAGVRGRIDRRRARDAPGAGRAGSGVDGILRMGDRLELTEEQRTRLETLRDEAWAIADRHEDGLTALRRDVRGGDVTPNRVRERLESLREERRAAAEPLRERIDDVLTESQRETLERVIRRVRGAGVRSRIEAGDRMRRDGWRVRRGPRTDGPGRTIDPGG